MSTPTIHRPSPPATTLPRRRPSSASILMLVADPQRGAQLRTMLQDLVPQPRLATEGNPIDALLLAAREPVDLVLADGALTRRLAPALAQQLGRMAPHTTLLLLDDPAPSTPGRCTVSWAEAPAWISRWLSARATGARAQTIDNPHAPPGDART